MRNFVWITGSLVGVMLAAPLFAETAKQAARQARRAARLAAATQSATPATSPVIEALKSAHNLLANADRDYDGHRAKAAEEVHQALRELGYHHALAAVKKAAPVASTGGSKDREAQSTSDAQLRQAQQILQGVAKSAHVTAAINEINKALTIR